MKMNLNGRAKLEVKESELEAVRLRLSDSEKGLNESKAEAAHYGPRVLQVRRMEMWTKSLVGLWNGCELSKRKWFQSGGMRKAQRRWSVATRDEVSILMMLRYLIIFLK